MVKFGRHLEYYASTAAVGPHATVTDGSLDAKQQQQQQHQQRQDAAAAAAAAADTSFYVVPYNDIKNKCIPPYINFHGEEKKQQEGDAAISHLQGINEAKAAAEEESTTGILKTKKKKDKPPPEPLSPTDAHFVTQRFKTEWRQCLVSASKDFEKQTKLFWGRIFTGLEHASSDNPDNHDQNDKNTIDPVDIRGALPDKALRLYLSHISTKLQENGNSIRRAEILQSLYSHLKTIHSTSLINSEALRKLVKKFDKEMSKLGNIPTTITNADGSIIRRLSSKLLPEVYSANFNVGLPTVEAGLTLIRHHLGLDEDDDEDEYDDNEDAHLSGVRAARIKFMSINGGSGGGLAGMVGGGGFGVGGGVENAMVDHDEDGDMIAEDVAGFFGLTLQRRDIDAVLVEKRKSELRWLRKLVESVKEADEIARNAVSSAAAAVNDYYHGDGSNHSGINISSSNIDMISCIVAHRGFHSIKDKSDKRPLENSLMAYEAAWTNGIHLCECDIALTSDDKLILAHDENFVRLALDLDDPLVHKNVQELTYKEIMSLPLKSGCRPPLLFDVLRSAQVIGGDARMIVEIKPGNVEAGTALARLFARHPHLMERCAVVMSFDAYAMQNLKRELEVVFPSLVEDTNQPPKTLSQPSIQRVGSPDYHDLSSGGGISTPTGVHTASHHHHRLGILPAARSGVIPKIPTAMSIGDFHSLVPPHTTTAAPSADAAPIDGLGSKSLSKSIDQLGMCLDGLDGLGGRKDSFNFSPFGQIGRVPSMNKQIATTATVTATVAQQQPANTLETIPGGKRVNNVQPHPNGVTPPLLNGETSADPVSTNATHGSNTISPRAPLTAQAHATTVVIPKLLLITRNGPAQNKEQEDALEINVTRESDIERARGWLHSNLDGLYMQYQSCMLEPAGIEAMRSLTDQYSVGIWGANPKPDDYETFNRLVKECGVSYINSGLPKRFMRNMRKSESSGNLQMVDKPSTAEIMDQNSQTWPKPPKQTVHLGLPW